jgi:hypothetical protein
MPWIVFERTGLGFLTGDLIKIMGHGLLLNINWQGLSVQICQGGLFMECGRFLFFSDLSRAPAYQIDDNCLDRKIQPTKRCDHRRCDGFAFTEQEGLICTDDQALKITPGK